MTQPVVATKNRATASRPRVGRLSTIGDIVSELGRLYRACRRGEVDPSDGTRLAFILQTLRGAIEASEVESRLEAIEARLGDGSWRT